MSIILLGDASAEKPLALILDLDDVDHCGLPGIFRFAIPVGPVGLLLHVVFVSWRQRSAVYGADVWHGGRRGKRFLDRMLARPAF